MTNEDIILAFEMMRSNRPILNVNDRMTHIENSMSAKQAPRNMSFAEQMAQYKPTEEQKKEALAFAANQYKHAELPRIIEMPTLEINRSDFKWINWFWDTVENIFIPNK